MSSVTGDTQRTIQPRSELDKAMDSGFIWLTRILAFAVAGTLIWITFQVMIIAFPAIQKFGLGFITSPTWDPTRDQYGALPQIYGTVVSSFISLLIAIPVGLGVAIFLSEDYLPPRIQLILVFLVELLAAIPSVVYGLWGLFVLIPILRDPANLLNTYLGWLPFFSTPLSGPGMLPAAVVLAIMVLPTIAALSRDALISLPSDLRQAAVGLGCTRWETILKVLLPAAFSGIVGAIMLALGRALGETMAVTMLIGNSNSFNPASPQTFSILAPSNTIAALLASQFAEAADLQKAALLYAALILFGITLLVNILAQLLVQRVQRI